jgi:hypothetical protein
MRGRRGVRPARPQPPAPRLRHIAQARPFYERLGYEVVGMLEGHPLLDMPNSS